MTTSKELFELSKQNINYSGTEKMVAIERQRNIGFFPAGSGLWEGNINDIIIDRKVLILGQDFNNEFEFAKFKDDDERSENPSENKTWINLRTLLKDLGIPNEYCFFSNVFMGLRKGEAKNTGSLLNRKDEKYRGDCFKFLELQIQTVRPKLILLLGLVPLKMFNKVFPVETADWKLAKTVKEIFENDVQVKAIDIDKRKIQVAFVIHPSLNAVNRKKIFGDDMAKEVRLLKEKINYNLIL